MKILLVDDERLVRICTESMLRELLGDSLACAQASGAACAEEWIREHGAPDLCFVDYKMPLCNGVELIRKLCAGCPDTKWVLMSGYDMTPEDQLREIPVDQVLSKPASLEELAEVLKYCGMMEGEGRW